MAKSGLTVFSMLLTVELGDSGLTSGFVGFGGRRCDDTPKITQMQRRFAADTTLLI